mmetsp:Transcript_85796/g.228023  ORF Transcript_85796/g.228023 Transcript_85796/m.228023 type:complete len:180 (-) Transcript_85796:127-666(-)
MAARVHMEFDGQLRPLTLRGASADTWDELCSSAAELSGLESFDMKYEDEEGYLQTLSEETLGDLIWVAEGAVPAARLVVRRPQDNVESLDLSLAMLRSRLSASSTASDSNQASASSSDGSPKEEEEEAEGGAPGWRLRGHRAAAEDKGGKKKPVMACCRRRRDAVILSDFVRHVVSQMF